MSKTQVQIKETDPIFSILSLLVSFIYLIYNLLKKYPIIFVLILGYVFNVVSLVTSLFLMLSYALIWIVFNSYYDGSKKHYDFFKLFIGIFLVGIISNQLIQPMFFPRISEMTVTPQYVINFGDNYELVSKHSYIIDLPLFPSTPSIGSNELDLKLPPPKYGQEKYLLFIENNPYMQFLYDFDSKDRITYNKSTDVISVNFTTDAWHVKSLNTDLYISEKTGQMLCYQDYNRQPNVTDEFPLDFRLFCKDYLGDYVHDLKEDQYYTLNINEIRNIGDLEIKGFKYLNLDNNTVHVCENDIELHIDDDINGKSVTIDLKPGDIKKLVFV